VELPTSGQCHLAKKATPRTGNLSRVGVSRRFSKNRQTRRSDNRLAIVVAVRPVGIDVLDVEWGGSLASGGCATKSVGRAPYKCNRGLHRARGSMLVLSIRPSISERLIQQLAMRAFIHVPPSGTAVSWQRFGRP
jgi:hypothetical protein